jgi:hypothetical protein
MPLTALQPQAKEIPPDLAAVLGDAPIHPELLHALRRPTPPTAATLTEAALAFVTFATMDLSTVALGTVELGTLGLGTVGLDAPPRVPLGAKGVIHAVGKGGVLHLRPSGVPRAVSLVRGTLAQRCTTRPSLRPGTVRLVPAGKALTLADLVGEGALAVEVVF